MGNDSMLKFLKECRRFGEDNFDQRIKIAEDFINKFVEKVATPMSVDDSDGAWTQSIRRRFFEICPEDCYPLPDAPWNTKGEFLADVTWVEIGKKKRILLACEIEWGTSWHGKTYWSHVAEAFEKLLPVKAPFKVFIFSSDYKLKKSKETVKGDFSFGFAKKQLIASLKKYRHNLAGEVYIFIDFPRTHDEKSPGIYQSFICLMKKYEKAQLKLENILKHDLLRPTKFEAKWRKRKK